MANSFQSRYFIQIIKKNVFFLVERVYVLAHMIVAAPIKANRLLQTCLSCAFSHLIVSTHDPNLAVAQRTILALKAMPSASLSVSGFLEIVYLRNEK